MTIYEKIKNSATIEQMADYFTFEALCTSGPNCCTKECSCTECWVEYLNQSSCDLRK